jgi:NADH-quinone oxidoreductase subunit M
MPSLLLIVFSLAVALLIGLLPEEKTSWARKIAISALSLQSLAACYLLFESFVYPELFTGIDKTEKFAYLFKYEWFAFQTTDRGKLVLNLFFGLDGLNTPLLIISIWVLTIGAIVSRNIQKREQSFYTLYMVLSATVTGAFSSLDFVLFFVFFEFMLVPMYLLIAVWGGERREYAAVKFFIYTFVGSLFILVSVIYLGLHCVDPVATAKNFGADVSNLDAAREMVWQKMKAGLSEEELKRFVFSFSLADMAQPKNFLFAGSSNFDNLRELIFWGIFIGFSIKLPVVPLHTWLPDAHTEASTPVSVVLAGILLKFGGYGLIRICGVIFPDMLSANSLLIATWGAFSLIYGGIMALGQTHLKRLVAYASIAHMGFIFVGIAAGNIEGYGGAVYQMFAHAILSPMLFIVAGVLAERSHHHLEIQSFGGLHQLMPSYSAFAALAFLAAMGMPFFCGFIGEFFVLTGAVLSPKIGTGVIVAVLLGMLAGVSYSIYTYRRIFLGKLFLRADMPKELFTDLKANEKIVLLLLTLLAFIFGIYPRLLWAAMEKSLVRMMELAA